MAAFKRLKGIFPGTAVLLLLTCSLAMPCHAASFSAFMDSLTRQIAVELSGKGKQCVAVVDFVDLDGNANTLGKYMAEEILVRLFWKGEIRVVERRLINKMNEEMKLHGSGLIDTGAARRIGSFLGVDAICAGIVTELQNTVKVNARMIDAQTGEVFSVATVEIPKRDIPDIAALDNEVDDRKKRPDYGSKSEYIKNGGFRKAYEGWTKTIGDVTKGYSKAEIISFAHAKSGKALHITHKGEGNIQFHQKIPVPGPDLIFAASFQAASREGAIRGFSGSGVVQIALQYFDEKGDRLGESILVNYVKNPFADTPLLGVPRRQDDSYKTHFVEVSQGSFHKQYKIDIRREITENLMGIDADAVRHVAVVLWCGASGSQAGSELWVSDLSLRGRK
jgi:TolB-like protein